MKKNIIATLLLILVIWVLIFVNYKEEPKVMIEVEEWIWRGEWK